MKYFFALFLGLLCCKAGPAATPFEIWVTYLPTDKVGRYDGQSGALISSFSTGLASGTSISGVTVGPDGATYVGWETSIQSNPGGVVRIDPITGAATQFTTDGNQTRGIAFAPDGRLFAAHTGLSTVGEYTSSGVSIAPTFESISKPEDLTIIGQLLFVGSSPSGVGSVQAYSLTDGGSSLSIPNIRDPRGIAKGPDGNLYIGSDSGVLKYSPAGTFLSTFVSGFANLNDLAFGPDGNLYIVDSLNGVLVYDGSSGAFLKNLIPVAGNALGSEQYKLTIVGSASSNGPGCIGIANTDCYDASLGTLPTAQGWTYSGDSNQNGTNPSPFVQGGALEENTTVGAQYWSIQSPTLVDFSGSVSLEAVLHIISSNEVPNVGTGTREGYYLDLLDGNQDLEFSIGLADTGFSPNSVLVPNQPLTPYPFPITDTYHVFKMTMNNLRGSLFIDGHLVADNLTPFAASGSTGRVLFGASAGASRSMTELKSVAYLGSTPISTPSCTYSLSPLSASYPASTPALGFINISTQAGCQWSPVSSAPWVVAVATPHTGSGSTAYIVTPNSGPARSASITIANQQFNISQSGTSCSATLSPTTSSLPNSGGRTPVTISIGQGCSWAAVSDVPWVSAYPSAGSGGSVVTLVAQANAGGPRSGTISIAGNVFTVSEEASACGATDVTSQSNVFALAPERSGTGDDFTQSIIIHSSASHLFLVLQGQPNHRAYPYESGLVGTDTVTTCFNPQGDYLLPISDAPVPFGITVPLLWTTDAPGTLFWTARVLSGQPSH